MKGGIMVVINDRNMSSEVRGMNSHSVFQACSFTSPFNLSKSAQWL